MPYVALACRCLIGVVFAVSAFGKLRGRVAFEEFVAWLGSLPIVPLRLRWRAAAAMAVSEASIVLLVALPWTVPAGLVLAAVVLALFAAGTFLVVRSGVAVACHCFGPSVTPLGMRHVARDTMLGAAAVIGVVAGTTGGAVTTQPAGIVLSLAAAAVIAMLVLFLDDLAALGADAGAAGGRP